uniref:Secreted protein n=2 Tax=Bursaphelenchus xylophilus TaxID=6326 RepID=A0A1I7SAT4_BURXY
MGGFQLTATMSTPPNLTGMMLNGPKIIVVNMVMNMTGIIATMGSMALPKAINPTGREKVGMITDIKVDSRKEMFMVMRDMEAMPLRMDTMVDTMAMMKITIMDIVTMGMLMALFIKPLQFTNQLINKATKKFVHKIPITYD